MKGFSIIFILLFAVVSFVHAGGSNGAPPPEEDCPGPHEVFNPCNRCAEEICGLGLPMGCTLLCRPRCECQKGFIRASADGPCIPKGQCTPSGPRCGKHEEWNGCGTLCPRICGEPEPEGCATVCAPGCFCKENFIRASRNGSCICEDECKRRG